jgi:DNA mismatch repair protein MutL
MSNIIRLLPDSVANQIAAGEVIQRPASVVKELMENAVDAGSTAINVIIKEAGRSLIQIIDNGSGMSQTDARMAFERHATSKIKDAADLFSIRTKGFRGEALASIAAVAQVELRTCLKGEELGTLISIAGTKIESQETIHCPVGSNFMIKNLFFNVPARRRFLKQNSTEFRHILNEFERVVLAHPGIEFSLTHNDLPVHYLPVGNLRQRIVHLMGKPLNPNLIPVDTHTHLVNINGFIGKPEAARKTMGDQFIFVNNRYIRHPYLHKAIMEAFGNLISNDSIPVYFLYLDVDPQIIDINIHPTKTEIKFEDERSIWHILNASVRESLGKFNIVPSIDFDTDGALEIPFMSQPMAIPEPEIPINPDYNPFQTEGQIPSFLSGSGSRTTIPSSAGWNQLYNGFETETYPSNWQNDNPEEFPHYQEEQPIQQVIQSAANEQVIGNSNTFYQFKNRFILSSVKSGLMMIDQKRAHERVLYEQFLNQMQSHHGISQQILFPEVLTFNSEDSLMLSELSDELKSAGIDLEENEDGDFEVRGLPSELEGVNIRNLLESILEECKNGEFSADTRFREKIALTMAQNAAIRNGTSLTNMEMQELYDRLFACSTPNYSPDGKPIITIISTEELEKRFQ